MPKAWLPVPAETLSRPAVTSTRQISSDGGTSPADFAAAAGIFTLTRIWEWVRQRIHLATQGHVSNGVTHQLGTCSSTADLLSYVRNALVTQTATVLTQLTRQTHSCPQ